MLANIRENPVVPLEWGSNQKGMQAGKEIEDTVTAETIWLTARDAAVRYAQQLADLGVHKQTVNRIVEPFMWMTAIISSTDWQHFFDLRCHPDAEPHFQHISKLIRETLASHKPKQLEFGDYHLPYVTEDDKSLSLRDKLKVSVARCARVSYLTHEGVRDVQKDIELHDRLATSGHWSPFEHVASADRNRRRYGNFSGFIQYRKTFHNEYRAG